MAVFNALAALGLALGGAARGNWLGADSHFSVVLSPTQTLMTFQDSFVGGVSAAMRAGSTMVGNRVARIGCDAREYAIDYLSPRRVSVPVRRREAAVRPAD